MTQEAEGIGQPASDSPEEEAQEKRGPQPESGKAPEGFLYFLWFIKNWKKYWREITGFAVFCFILFALGQLGVYLVDQARTHFSSVTVRVLHFDHSTGALTLEFNNNTRSQVPVDSVYITVAPTNSVPTKPMPPEIQRLLSVLDKNVMRIPSGAGLEIGPVLEKPQLKARLLRMAVFLLRDTPPVTIPPGTTSTNLVPRGNAFAEICDQFAQGAELEILLHTSLIDSEGRLRMREIPMGNYFIGENQTGIKRVPNPKVVDILRAAKVGGHASEQASLKIPGTLKLPPLDSTVEVAYFENSAPGEVLLKIGEHLTGLVPVVFVKKSISYGCLFRVVMEPDERLPTDVAAWVLTRDEGKTVMNLPMAFSNSWPTAPSVPTPEKEYAIPLPSTNWHVLIGGQRWARIAEGTIKYTVNERTWIKLLPADETTYQLLYSNYSRIASQEVSDDPTWSPVTNAATYLTNSKTFVIVRNEVTPDLSMFTTLSIPASQSTNDHNAKLPVGSETTTSGTSIQPSSVDRKTAPQP